MTETKWTDELLEPMRELTDPPADEVVKELFQHNEVGAVNRLMKTLVYNDDVPMENLPPVVRSYLDRTDDLPPWADLERIRRGGEFFGVHGPGVVLALHCASLPACYAAAKGVQVLHLTSRLESDATRRVTETAQMVVDVMAPGGLEPGGAGLRDAQKVRLMHAAVRHLIEGSGRWNPEFGRPINQEDMAGTIVSFSIPVIDSLQKLGETISDEEADGYFHIWNIVGHLMGVDRQLLPDTIEEGRALAAAIERRHWRPCPEGRAMTKALVDMMEYLTPGTLFDGLPSYLIRFLSGDHLADMLGVKRPDWTSMLAGPLRFFASGLDAITDEVPIVGKITSIFSRTLLEGIGWVARGGERAPFTIPDKLAERWQIRTPNSIR